MHLRHFFCTIYNPYSHLKVRNKLTAILYKRYTHKMSGFKTSGFKTSGCKTSGFKTSETSGLQNVRFIKSQVYKMSGLQNIRLQKNIHVYSVPVVGGNPQVLLQPCLQAK